MNIGFASSHIPNKAAIGQRLALGTVQFGMNYGIANKHGQVPAAEVKSILSLALANGVETLDTAMDYGQSEVCLGANGVADFNVITKLTAIPNDVINVEKWVRTKVEASLARLNIASLKGLLLHRPAQLSGSHGPALVRALCDLKNAGLIEKIGVSIYSPEELPSVLDACSIDLVQASFNLIDRRLATSGWLQKLHESEVEVHTRSAFLQGLLLMPRAEIPAKFNRWSKVWDEWRNWLAINRCSAIRACLQFVLEYPQISKVVVGVDSAGHLRQLLETSEGQIGVSWPDISVVDEALVNPANWNNL